MSLIAGASAVIRRVLSPTEPSNRVLRLGLGVLAAAASFSALRDLIVDYPWGVDLDIALKAAERWLGGGRVYLPESFASGPGSDLPFLYPPYALPLFAPLTAAARQPLHAAWLGASLTLAVATCRHLGVQSRWIPLILVWPPFAEGLISGNVQIATFAAFIFLLTGTSRGEGVPAPGRRQPLPMRGLLAAATVFLKVGQPHVIVFQSRWDRRAAAVAVLAIAALVAATLPLTGTSIWVDWIDQLGRAADPAWSLGGPSLPGLLPSPFGAVIIVACLAGALAVGRQDASAWVGVLLVLGSPALHTYYLLFLIPAMLLIRREISLVAALLIATYREPAWWLAIAIVVVALAGSTRNAGLRERATASRDDHPGAGAGP